MMQDTSAPHTASWRRWPVLMWPVAFYVVSAAYEIVLMPICWLVLLPDIVDRDAYLETFVIWSLYVAAIVAGAKWASWFGQSVASRILSKLTLGLSDQTLEPRLTRTVVILFLVLYACSFVLLALTSGAGLLWITDSRAAYQLYRTGVGVIWVITFACLFVSYMFSLFADIDRPVRGSPLWRLLRKALPYSLLAFFLGSKSFTLSCFIAALLFYNYTVGPIRWQALAAAGAVFWLSAVSLQLIQGSAAGLAQTIFYADYFHNTSEFLRRFDEFGGFRYGAVFLSDLWSYVPRGLVPDKPAEYGQLLINQVLFPGAAENKYTPGLAPWASNYLDLGVAGVLFSGFVCGLMLGWVHNYFLANRTNVIRFIILLQLGGIVPIFAFVPVPAFLLLVLPAIGLFLLIVRTVLSRLTVPLPADTVG